MLLRERAAVTVSSLPCWRRRFGALGQRGATVSWRMCRMACGRGWWMSGRRLRKVVVRRGGGLDPPRYDGPTGQNRCLVWVWVTIWMKTAWAEGSSTRLDRLWAMQSSIWLLHRGGGPEIGGFGGNLDENCVGRGFVDHDWITFRQCEGRSGCYAGAAPPEQVVCVVAFVDLGRVGGGSLRLCHCFVQIV